MEFEALINMEIENFITKMKDIYSTLITFIDTNDDTEDEFQKLINTFEKQKIFENKGEVKLIFQLISKVFDNYHRTSEFLDKIEKIIQYLIKDFSSSIPNFISDYTKYNKKLLLFLLEKKIIKPDESFLKKYLQNKRDNEEFQLVYYLYPKIKEFLEEKTQNQIEKEILEKFNEDISSFEKKCQIGENDSYICSLIRSDSVEDFVSYVNRTNLKLSSKIKQSIFETNSFLIDKEPTLIEYASFFGSIQIIQYLKYNNVPLTFSLWIYAIHSNNAEMIHFLEDHGIKPENNKLYEEIFLESIKCHHNAISNYILDNFYDQIQTDDHIFDSFSDTIINSLNFFFFPNRIDSKNNKGFELSKLHFLLMQITIPSSVTLIRNGTFYKCTLLTQISIPSSVTSIGNDAFYGCSSLSKVSFENNSSVTTIGNDVFYGCSSLTQIEIPQSVTLIGNGTFSGCSSLSQITIPQSVTSIGNDVFYGCSSLSQITIPSSVTSIGNNAFYKCSLLAQVSFEIPSLITSIGNGVFYGCTSLKHISIPSLVATIGNGAFYECSSLTQITIPSSVTSIGYYALYGCTSLVQISFEIPSSLTVIGIASFFGCTSLKQITIPSSVTSIGVFSFTGCLSLEQISIPSSVTSIKNSANESTSLTQIIRLVDIIKELSILLETKENYPKLYKLPTIITKTNHSKRIRKIKIGPQVSSSKDEIKILIVGETGSGKTTFINCIANYLYGVKWGDDCRFIVAPNGYEYEKNVLMGNAVDDYITEYTFYWQPGFAVSYTVTLIDTPGFHNYMILNQHESLLKNINDFGIEYFNAVAITIQSSTPRLNSFYHSFFDSIMKLFGNDIANNFIIITTFVDAGEPIVLDSLRANHVPTDYVGKFNNSALYGEFKGKYSLINKIFWDIGQESIKNIFKYSEKMEPKSLNHFS